MPGNRSVELVLAVVLALVAATIVPVAAQPDDTPDEDDNPGDDEASDRRNESDRGRNESEDRDDEDDEDDEDDDRRGPPDHAGPPAGVGRVEAQDGRIDGAFLGMDVTGDGVANVTVSGTPIFAAIHVDGLEIDEVRARGADVRIEGEAGGADVELRFHDTPSASARMEADDEAVLELDLHGDVIVSDDTGRRITLVAGNAKAFLWKEDGTLSVDNGTIRASDDARLRFTVAQPGDRDDDGIGSQIAEAASEGRVGAEVRMIEELDELRSEIVTYSNLSVMASKKADGVLVVVESDDETGRTVVLHADRELLDNGTSDLQVRFDGRNISQADNLDDVLEVTPGEAPEYVAVVGASDVQVLVAVPSFSAHTIEVASVGQVLQQIGLSPQQAAAAFGAAAATVIVAALVAGKRRR